MVKVKICGLKRTEDIQYVNKLKPDYVGFVFAESSRKVSPKQAETLISKLDIQIKKVGIFLNEDKDKVKDIAHRCNLDVIQLHGDESPAYCGYFDREIWKAFRVRSEECLYSMNKYPVKGFLLDTYVKNQYGGTGQTFNWHIVPSANQRQFIILAGGLNPENVRRAIITAQPTVVDVSGGVESNGVKDYDKIAEFIRNVRGLDG